MLLRLLYLFIAFNFFNCQGFNLDLISFNLDILSLRFRLFRLYRLSHSLILIFDRYLLLVFLLGLFLRLLLGVLGLLA